MKTISKLRRWSEYNKKTYIDGNKKTSASKWLISVLKKDKQKTRALSLGTGIRIFDLQKILNEKYQKITCVDIDNSIKKVILNLNPKKLEFINSNLKDIDLKKSYSMVTANNVLSFLYKKDFLILIKKIKKSLEKDGFFQGNVFGKNDDWKNRHTEAVILKKYSKKELQKKLEKEFKVIKIIEEEYDTKSTLGYKKHWHDIVFIVKRK